MSYKKNSTSALLNLMNVGKAVYQDLQLLGITDITMLAQQDPDTLYQKLEKLTGKHQNPCVWDVFAAIIYQAKTGNRKPWWEFSPIRRERACKLCKH